MDLRRELITIIGLLVALCVLLAFGSLALFDRMGPAIDRILQANVYSITAAEEARVLVASAGEGPIDATCSIASRAT